MTATRESIEYHGTQIVLSLFEGDHVTRTISASSGFYEQLMLEDMMRRTKPGDLAVDVGAYVGTHTVFLAAIAHLEVIALEPASYSADLLRENVEQNGLSGRVVIRQSGAGSKAGTADVIRGPEANLGMSKLEVGPGPIPVTTVDDILEGRDTALLKIDVEGMELEVLEGAEQTLASSRPLVYVEVAHPESERLVAEHLSQAGYRFAREFNRTPSQLWVPFDHHAPSIYPDWLVAQASDQAYSLRDTMRLVEQLRDAQQDQVRELREYRTRLEQATNLLLEFYKRTQAATRSNLDLMQQLEDIRELLERQHDSSPEASADDASPSSEEE